MQPIILLSLYAASALSVMCILFAILFHLTRDRAMGRAVRRRERVQLAVFCVAWPIACFVALPIAAMIGATFARGV